MRRRTQELRVGEALNCAHLAVGLDQACQNVLHRFRYFLVIRELAAIDSPQIYFSLLPHSKQLVFGRRFQLVSALILSFAAPVRFLADIPTSFSYSYRRNAENFNKSLRSMS